MTRLATIGIIAALAVHAAAAPGDGSGSGSAETEIEMGDSTGSGSGSGSGSAAPVTEENAPIVKDPKVAKKWLSAAQTLVQKGDYFTRANRPIDAKQQYENAVVAFGKAIEAGDDVGVFLQLALVEDKLGQDASAYKHLKLVVDPKAQQKPDVVKKAQAKLDEVTAKVGTVTLTVTPAGTQIMMAGKTVGEAPMTEPLVLDAGTYTLSFAAVGYQPRDVELKVEAGSESDRKIALEPVPVVVKAVEGEEPGGAPEKPAGPPILPLYIGAGAAAGLFLIGTITGLSAVADHSTFTDPATSSADRKDAQSQGRTLAHVTDALFVTSIAAGAFTAYWYLYKWAPAQRATGTDHWLLFGWAAPSGGGIAASGSF